MTRVVQKDRKRWGEGACPGRSINRRGITEGRREMCGNIGSYCLVGRGMTDQVDAVRILHMERDEKS